MRAARRSLAALLLAATAGSGALACKGKGRAPAPAVDAAAPHAPPTTPATPPGPSPLAGITETKPSWLVRLPDMEARIGIPRLAGPVLAADAVLVSGRDLGVVGLAQSDGARRWQLRPGLEVEGAIARGAAFLVAGRCAGERTDGGAAPVGCLEVLWNADGRQVSRADVTIPPRPRFAGDFAGAPSRLLGYDEKDRLLWARGLDLLAIEVTSGVARRALHGEPRADGAELPPPSSDPAAYLLDLDRASIPQRISIAARSPIAQVRDGALTVWSAGALRHTVEGNFAQAPGALWVRHHADACGFDQVDGVAPVCVDATTLEEQRGERVPGVQVLAAAGTADGGVVAVVRLDTTLTADAVVAWSGGGTLRWAWPIPAPAAPRADDIGIAADRQGVYVFWDARFVARFALAPTAPPR